MRLFLTQRLRRYRSRRGDLHERRLPMGSMRYLRCRKLCMVARWKYVVIRILRIPSY